ncbi:universal stress protein [Nitrincola schmidtii]|uniref:universal stress protein n=1 Tax=Nitrincola schmidtii TaxID=1730894 RepID=UPI00124BD3E8|nr:universal stress protein [Nitrincola schmidtii]
MAKLSKMLVNMTTEEPTDSLLDKAIRVSECANTSIELFKCGYQSYPSSMSMISPAMLDNLQHQRMRAMEKVLDQIASSYRHHSCEITTDVAWAKYITDGVLTKAKRFQPDLILHEVAEHPHLLHRLLAPQDWLLLREAQTPLLLCKEQPWPEHMRIVAAIDPFHAHDKAAEIDLKILQYAQVMAKSLGAELHILHTFASIPQSAIFDDTVIGDFESMHLRIKAEHEARLKEVVLSFDPSFDLSLLHVVEGEIHRKLPEFVREKSINMVVMGSLARGMIDRLLLGSSVERVLDAVPCDILVLKP